MKFVLFLVIVLTLVSAVAEAETAVAVGTGAIVPVVGGPSSAFSLGADVLGIKTDMQLGAMNLRLWLSRTPYGSSECGATVDSLVKVNLWQPRCKSGYQYLIGSIDVSGVDYIRLKDVKGYLKTENRCIPLCFERNGCIWKFSINLGDLPNGLYAVDLASINNARKISLKLPVGSWGITRENQRVNGYFQFTMFDPTTILEDLFTGIPELAASCGNDPKLRSRIEEAYLLQRFSYTITPVQPDLDLATLQGRLNQLLSRQAAMNGDGQPLEAGTITYFIKFTYPDGTDYHGPVLVYADDEDGSYPAFQVTAPLVKMGDGATEGTKGFGFKLLTTGNSIPRETFSVKNGTVVPITVPWTDMEARR